jgi:hypothetical protein
MVRRHRRLAAFGAAGMLVAAALAAPGRAVAAEQGCVGGCRIFETSCVALAQEKLGVERPAAPREERRFIYDTTKWSQSNAGHTFGDHLTPGERRAVIEYLKTL